MLVEQSLESFVEDVLVVELRVKVDDVVVGDWLAGLRFVELLGEGPGIHVHTRCDEQVDGSMFGRLHYRHLADRAAKRVFASIVVEANAYPNV